MAHGKTARLNELNAMLNLDKRGNEIVDGERAEEEPQNHPQTENAKKKITAAIWDICIAAVFASWKMCRVCDIMMLTNRYLRDTPLQDTLLFFDRHQAVYPLYTCFQEKLLARFPESRIKVQKSQISYYNRHLYACVSFLKVKKKAKLPDDYFVLTLGLPAPPESDRVAAKTEPYPGRWTTHFVISSPSNLDEELFNWIEQAYQFAQTK